VKGVPHSSKHSDKKKTISAATIEYSWSSESPSTEGDWCYIRTYLPKKYAGGMVITHKNDADTKVALKVEGTIARFFDNETLKTNAIGNTGKVSLYFASSIDLFMKQQNKYTTSLDTKDQFKIVFTRETNYELGMLVLKHGGVIVWVIIGCTLLCLAIIMICLWKKCAGG
jgi:hypothetical protein